MGGESSTPRSNQKLWRELWHRKVPKYVQHFVWRACQDILTTLMNLKSGKITNLAKCPICEQEDETSIHILWECLVANDIWGDKGSPLRKWSKGFFNTQEFRTTIVNTLSVNNPVMCAMIFRNLLGHENAFIHEKTFQSPNQLLGIAKVQLEASK